MPLRQTKKPEVERLNGNKEKRKGHEPTEAFRFVPPTVDSALTSFLSINRKRYTFMHVWWNDLWQSLNLFSRLQYREYKVRAGKFIGGELLLKRKRREGERERENGREYAGGRRGREGADKRERTLTDRKLKVYQCFSISIVAAFQGRGYFRTKHFHRSIISPRLRGGPYTSHHTHTHTPTHSESCSSFIGVGRGCIMPKSNRFKWNGYSSRYVAFLPIGILSRNKNKSCDDRDKATSVAFLFLEASKRRERRTSLPAASFHRWIPGRVSKESKYVRGKPEGGSPINASCV